MSSVCEVCGKKPVAGRSYARRGLAKSKGGVGRKITGVTKRRFRPNVQVVRIVDEKGTVRRSRICVKCLRTGLRKGTIQKAVRKSRAPRPTEIAEPTSAVPAVSEEHVETRPADEGEFGRAAAESGTESETRADAPEAADFLETAETTEDRESEAEAAETAGEESLGGDSLDNRDAHDDEPRDE